jgi:conjugal transfer/entry exclusion protein
MLQNVTMHQVLLYSSLFIAILSLIIGFYACGRIAKFISSTNDLDWTAIANMTGDLASTKKTIQTLNNRINGMHSPKLQEQELMLQLLQNREQKPNGKIVGG